MLEEVEGLCLLMPLAFLVALAKDGDQASLPWNLLLVSTVSREMGE